MQRMTIFVAQGRRFGANRQLAWHGLHRVVFLLATAFTMPAFLAGLTVQF